MVQTEIVVVFGLTEMVPHGSFFVLMVFSLTDMVHKRLFLLLMVIGLTEIVLVYLYKIYYCDLFDDISYK